MGRFAVSGAAIGQYGGAHDGGVGERPAYVHCQ
jgi:hypothetical protein